MNRYVLAIDLGGTKIAAARVDESGAISQQTVTHTPTAGDQSVVQAIAGKVEQLPTGGAAAIGVAVPGLAYPDGSVWAPNIPGWKRVPLGEILSRRFRLPVLIESDRNAFVIGEAWKGAAQNCRDIIFVAMGTGIGAGIISGGRLVRGYGELAGCVGWTAIRDRFRSEYGAVGCLEFHAAGPGIARAGRRVYRRAIDTRELVRRARRGDPKAKQILCEAGHALGLGLANLVSILNPEVIVVGGGLSAAGNLLLEPARQTILQWAQPLAGKQVRLRRSRLGGRAGLLGAAKLAFQKQWQVASGE